LIAALPVPPARRPLLRMIFLTEEPGAAGRYRTWADRLGPAADARVAPPGEVVPMLAGPARPVPTVLVAARGMIRSGLALCHGDWPPDRLIALPAPGTEPPPGDPPVTPVTVLAESASPGAGDGATAWLTRWRRVSRGPVSVRVLPCRLGLLDPGSPVPLVLAEIFFVGPRWVALASQGTP
jgi:hypothetical protein